MAAGSWVVGGDCERGLEASERSWSREYEMRGVPPGVVPYTQAPEAELGAAAVRIGMVDDMVVRGCVVLRGVTGMIWIQCTSRERHWENSSAWRWGVNVQRLRLESSVPTINGWM